MAMSRSGLVAAVLVLAAVQLAAAARRKSTTTVFQIEGELGLTADALNKRRFFEAFDNQRNCFLTQVQPEKPRSLSFCHKFNDKACCAPADDDEANEMFATMFDLGLSCRLRGDVRSHPLAKIYCMNCDPEQPTYVRNSPYPPGVNATGFADSPTSGREQTLLVCKEWMDGEFLDGDEIFGEFERCGILVSSPCLGDNQEALDGRDRYTCGDDVIRPQSTFQKDDDGNFVSTTVAYEAFINYNSMGTPQLDENFGFLVVENRGCDDSEVVSGSSDNYTAAPRCLMSAAQQQLYYGFDSDSSSCGDDTYAKANASTCAALVAEKCFNAAAGVAPSLLLLVALVVLTIFLS